MGGRLKQHPSDSHGNKRNRFSWFGFRRDLAGKDNNGFNKLKDVAETQNVAPKTVIEDIEAVLIKAMGLSNINEMNIGKAKEWAQIKSIEEASYIEKRSS